MNTYRSRAIASGTLRRDHRHGLVAFARRASAAIGSAPFVASLLFALVAQSASAQSTSTSLRVSLRIVETCDLSVSATAACREAEYERWLQKNSVRKIIIDEQGRSVVEVRF